MSKLELFKAKIIQIVLDEIILIITFKTILLLKLYVEMNSGSRASRKNLRLTNLTSMQWINKRKYKMKLIFGIPFSYLLVSVLGLQFLKSIIQNLRNLID